MASIDNLVSGSIIEETRNASSYAYKLAQKSNYKRNCAIAIANESNYNLKLPKVYLSSGTIGAMPLEIPAGCTGLILGTKTGGTARGSVGTVTYEMQDRAKDMMVSHKLQVMWHVPFDYNLFENLVNVNIDIETASEDLHNQMYRGEHGTKVRASETSFETSSLYDGKLKVTVLMSDTSKSSITILLRSAK